MAQDTTAFRQVTYHLAPQTRESWRWLERTLEARRTFCNTALQERIDCYARTGCIVTCHCKGLIERGTLKRSNAACRSFFRRGDGFPHPKGRGHRSGRSGLDQPDLRGVRRHRRQITQDASCLPVRGLQPCGQRRAERSGEHSGIRDWRCCAGRLPGLRTAKTWARLPDGWPSE